MSLQMDDGTIRKNGNYKEFTKLTKKIQYISIEIVI
jgi:hypothetical protein